MKISLIENGLDSLTKGYQHLKTYEELNIANAADSARFGALKDAIISLQHGIEILFKHILRQENEVLLFSEVNPKLRKAYQSRRKGEIVELFEAEGVHTVTFKESMERITDILGIEIEGRLRDILSNVERWRNGIIHAGVVLNEHQVSNVLKDAMHRLDAFFGGSIGQPYLDGLGRQEMERAFRLFEAVHGRHQNAVKAGVIRQLGAALTANGIRDVKAPGVFMIEDAAKAFAVLQAMVGDQYQYGCDLANFHCSGKADVSGCNGKEVTIYCADNNSYYRFLFGGMVVFVPPVQADGSPLIFLYSETADPLGIGPNFREVKGCKTQVGFFVKNSGQELWSKSEYEQFYEDLDDDSLDERPAYSHLVRFLSAGMVCFMNVQGLSPGRAKNYLYDGQYINPRKLFSDINAALAKPERAQANSDTHPAA